MSRPYIELTAAELERRGVEARAAGDESAARGILDELGRRGSRAARKALARIEATRPLGQHASGAGAEPPTRLPVASQPQRVDPSMAAAGARAVKERRAFDLLAVPPAPASRAGRRLPQARAAVEAEHRMTTRSARLIALSAEPTARDPSIHRVRVGAVELEPAWEGGRAFSPRDLDGGLEDIDRAEWVGTVYELDPVAAELFIGVDDVSTGRPGRGPFIVSPFEFTAALAKVYRHVAGVLAAKLERALGLAADEGERPTRISKGKLGLAHLEGIWGHDWSQLWGPPGTGKTYTIGEMVAAAASQARGGRILVVSTTNKATDGVALSVVRAARARGQSIGRVVRMGAGADLLRFERDDAVEVLDGAETALRAQLAIARRALDGATDGEERAVLKKRIALLQRAIRDADMLFFEGSHDVVVSTAHKALSVLGAALEGGPMQSFPPFATVVVDEAGLVSRAAVAAVSLLARDRVILVGDPRQLAPISRVARIEEPERMRWLAESGLAHLDPGQPAPNMHMLTVQYRMTPEVCAAVSRYQYGGRLSDAPQATADTKRPIDRALIGQPRAMWYVLDEDSSGLPAIRAERPPSGGSWHRPYLMKVLERVFDAHPAMAAGEGIVLSPFVSQGRAAREWLAKRGLTGWTASTVHMQQGAEYDYVVFDTVYASSTAWSAREWTRLVNVGMSRARRFMLLVASRAEMQQLFLKPLRAVLAPRVLAIRRLRAAVWREVGSTVEHGLSAERRTEHPERLGAQLEDRRALLPLMSREQERLCQLKLDDGARLVRGVAGSGKTLVLAHWVVQTLEALPSGRLWVVYGNASLHHLLAECIDDALAKRGLEDHGRIELHHVGKVLEDLLRKAGIKGLLRSEGKFNYDAQAQAYLRGSNPLPDLCDALFVDEGQDMGPETLRLLNLLVRARGGRRRRFVVFYDNAQNIYARGTPIWSQMDIDMRGRSTIMKESFRSTVPVTELALNTLYRLKDPQDDPDHRELERLGLLQQTTLNGRPWWRVGFCHSGGPVPMVTLCDTREQERAVLSKQLAVWVRDEGVRPRDIVVLVSRSRAGEQLAETLGGALAVHGVRVAYAARDAFDTSDDVMHVTTPHSFKGHDAEVIVVAECDKFTAQGLPLPETLYVAMTRARSVLHVSGVRSGGAPAASIIGAIATAEEDLRESLATRPPSVGLVPG